ncbi:unnamed protein product [Echinostoma caproni]|uniref:Secreted protein n=1 Tax=Echinostoma caproni TaxID=27848 RepID=A0A182ZZD8_9TREM|nr:unnamed protein product [Echinostoma caproni]
MQQTTFVLSLSVILFGLFAHTQSTPFGLLDPQAEYLNALRVDSALERCIELVGTQSGRRDRSQMERLRQCMLREFSGKISSDRWKEIEGMA